MKHSILAALTVIFCAVPGLTAAAPFGDRIPIFQRGASTFYVEGHIEGVGTAPLLVDTGSGYTAIDRGTFHALDALGNVAYVKQLQGVMADGTKKIVPIYRIPGIHLGGSCFIEDLEVAVFPHKTRLILGLNALRKVAPFAFSLEQTSPSLLLSNCRPAALSSDSGRPATDRPAVTSGPVLAQD